MCVAVCETACCLNVKVDEGAQHLGFAGFAEGLAPVGVWRNPVHEMLGSLDVVDGAALRVPQVVVEDCDAGRGAGAASDLQDHRLEVGHGLEVTVAGDEDGAMLERLRGEPDVVDWNRRPGRP